MIKRFKMLFYKDFLILIRDVWGLGLLFLMPWILVILMTYLQDSTFRSVNEKYIPLYILDYDKDTIGAMITEQILASGMFNVFNNEKKSLSQTEVESSVARGDYLIGVIIPKGVTANLRAKVRSEIAKSFGEIDELQKDTVLPCDQLATIKNIDTTYKPELCNDVLQKKTQENNIIILTDPIVKQSFRQTILQVINENALKVQNKLLLSEISYQINRLVPIPIEIKANMTEVLTVSEKYAINSDGRIKIVPNSTQHNVPAWSMFAIFFIVISLSSNMIRERETGCFNRLMTTTCSFPMYLLSKITVYLCVCLLQMTLMFVSGMFILPLLGLPSLQPGTQYMSLFITSLTSSLAAIGYGIALGSIAGTNQQASIFGAVSVVILAALGGVWIPTFIMPCFMQLLSLVSPLNWGLNAFNEIFVRNSEFQYIIPYISASFLFFIISLIIACIFRYDKR